jgi:hypothetical protein
MLSSRVRLRIDRLLAGCRNAASAMRERPDVLGVTTAACHPPNGTATLRQRSRVADTTGIANSPRIG